MKWEINKIKNLNLIKKSNKKIVKYSTIPNKLKNCNRNMKNSCKDSIMKNIICKKKFKRKVNN